MLRFCAFLVLCGWRLSGQAAPERKTVNPLADFSQSIETLSQRCAPAVVQVLVTSYGVIEEREAEGAAVITQQRVTGSGVLVDPNGYIITNAHVVKSALRVRVSMASRALPGAPARSILSARTTTVDARIIGIDRETDLAVLKAPGSNLPFLPIGNSDQLRQGQVVLAFGSPRGLENSVSMGVVSSMARQIKTDDPMIYIQTDAPINPGNSGGPLVNVEGQVMGINTFILTQSGGSEGIGFAVPGNIVNNVYRQIRKTGHVHRGEIGVVAQTITPALQSGLKLPREWGVLISDVTPDGPADKAGMKLKDIVLTLNGKQMENARQFEVNLYSHDEGEEVTLEVLRGNGPVTLRVPVILRSDKVDQLASTVTPDKNFVPVLGVLCLDIDEQVAALLGPFRSALGVIVVAMAAEGRSREVTFAPGDVIHSINDQFFQTVEELRGITAKLKPGDAVVGQVERSGRLMYLSFTLE
jgi:serine protease Do